MLSEEALDLQERTASFPSCRFLRLTGSSSKVGSYSPAAFIAASTLREPETPN